MDNGNGGYQGVIFDLYGTLIDINSEESNRLFLKEIQRIGGDKSEAYKRAMCFDYSDMDSYIVSVFGEDTGNHLQIRTQIEKELNSAVLFSDTIETILDIKSKGYKIAVLSNMSTPYKEPFFKFGFNKFFDNWVFSCEAGMKKPDKGLYHLTADIMGINPEKLLMVGDNVQADYKGAENAGIRSLLIDRDERHEVERRIFSLNGVLDYLERRID